MGGWKEEHPTEDGGRFPRGLVGPRGSTFLGGCVLTGGKRSDPDELVRFLNDALKPKLYAYDRYADAYLRIPT